MFQVPCRPSRALDTLPSGCARPDARPSQRETDATHRREPPVSEKQRHHPRPRALSLHAPQEWPELLSPQDVATLMRIATGTVARWCETGQIEAVRVGRRWRIPPQAVWPLVPPSIRAQWPDGPWRTPDEADSSQDT